MTGTTGGPEGRSNEAGEAGDLVKGGRDTSIGGHR